MGVNGDLLALIESFLFERQFKRSAIGTLYISTIYHTDSNVKPFANDTSMSLVVCDHINTSQKLNNDLERVSLCANKWKMSFNPDPSKQVQELIFSRKMNKGYHPTISFNNSTGQQIYPQKRSGINLDELLTFKHQINEKIIKANKGVNIFPSSNLLQIYRSFVRAHLGYGDVIYDHLENELFI